MNSERDDFSPYLAGFDAQKLSDKIGIEQTTESPL
jgi:hypothetical protein